MFLIDTVSVLNLTSEPLQNKEVKRTFSRGGGVEGKGGAGAEGCRGQEVV